MTSTRKTRSRGNSRSSSCFSRRAPQSDWSSVHKTWFKQYTPKQYPLGKKWFWLKNRVFYTGFFSAFLFCVPTMNGLHRRCLLTTRYSVLFLSSTDPSDILRQEVRIFFRGMFGYKTYRVKIYFTRWPKFYTNFLLILRYQKQIYIWGSCYVLPLFYIIPYTE